jgi:hypothetical protein
MKRYFNIRQAGIRVKALVRGLERECDLRFREEICSEQMTSPAGLRAARASAKGRRQCGRGTPRRV